ncbi:hypothetical protein CLOM_g6285 [Closterium sp. NIES-68]|nr:hypothetical protein CLOM_g6285 [Closterium sp. NIES-68]GJP74583.1 hypothetical protein CLOP_g5144 [Closterium sp. NIES-67]
MAQIAARLMILFLASTCVSFTHASFVNQLSASGYTDFANLLSHAGLEREIDGMIAKGRTVTVFAPTNAGIAEHISPVGLTTMVLPANRAALRQLLLHHFIPHSVSLFSWKGAATSSTGSAISLSMDALYFYAGGVPVQEVNALAAKNFVVHSVRGVIVPAPLAASMRPLRPQATSSAVVAGGSRQSRKMAPVKAAAVAERREDELAAVAAAKAAAVAAEAEAKVSKVVAKLETSRSKATTHATTSTTYATTGGSVATVTKASV